MQTLVVALLCLGNAQAQSSTSGCIPTVLIAGEEALVRGVGAYLGARGLSIGGPLSDCGKLWVYLSTESGKVRVLVRDAAGRDDSRLVTDSATASAFIESRVRSDLAMVLPEPNAAHNERPPPIQAHAPAVDTAHDDAKPNAFTPSVTARFRPGVSLATDGSAWVDAAASGCVAVDPLCLGATLRGSLDLGVSGRSAELLTERGGFDALVTAEVPFSAGPALRLAPGVGIGAGWLQAGPRGSAEGSPGAEVAANFGGPRLEAFGKASWSIAQLWALGGIVYGVLDPMAHTSDLRDPDALLAGNPLLRVGAALEIAYGAP